MHTCVAVPYKLDTFHPLIPGFTFRFLSPSLPHPPFSSLVSLDCRHLSSIRLPNYLACHYSPSFSPAFLTPKTAYPAPRPPLFSLVACTCAQTAYFMIALATCDDDILHQSPRPLVLVVTFSTIRMYLISGAYSQYDFI